MGFEGEDEEPTTTKRRSLALLGKGRRGGLGLGDCEERKEVDQISERKATQKRSPRNGKTHSESPPPSVDATIMNAPPPPVPFLSLTGVDSTPTKPFGISPPTILSGLLGICLKLPPAALPIDPFFVFVGLPARSFSSRRSLGKGINDAEDEDEEVREEVVRAAGLGLLGTVATLDREGGGRGGC